MALPPPFALRWAIIRRRNSVCSSQQWSLGNNEARQTLDSSVQPVKVPFSGAASAIVFKAKWIVGVSEEMDPKGCQGWVGDVSRWRGRRELLCKRCPGRKVFQSVLRNRKVKKS